MNTKKILIIFIIFAFVFTGTVWCQQQGMELKIFSIKGSNAESIYSVVKDLVSREGNVSFNPNTNSLIVFDTPGNLERIGSVIEHLDVVQKQVQIKVIVADVTDSFLQDIGLQGGRVIIPHGRFSAMVNLLKSSENSSIRSQMMLTTLSNQPATLQVSKDEIFGQSLIRYRDGTWVRTYEREPIGNFLEVLPRVNNDGTISVALRPSVSTLQEDHTKFERTVLTEVVINNGDTIAIGGVDSARQEVTRDEIPIFDVPLSKRSSQESKKVVMFLTATVLE